MNLAARWLLAIAVFMGGAISHARIQPAPPGQGPIPNVVVFDDTDHQLFLREWLVNSGNKPIIVAPIYTRCMGSCQGLTLKLKSELSRMGRDGSYKVLLFSFDPAETAEGLRRFRKLEGLPSSWEAVHSDERNIRDFFAFFHYPIMTEGSIIVHPNLIFLLGLHQEWRSSFAGMDWNSADLKSEISRIQSPNFLQRLKTNPTILAQAGFGGLLFSFCIFAAWVTTLTKQRTLLRASDAAVSTPVEQK